MPTARDKGTRNSYYGILYHRYEGPLMSPTDTAQVISSVAAVVALFLIWRQLRYQNIQNRLVALSQLHEELMRVDMQRALRFIYANPPERLARPQSSSELEALEAVLNAYDLIGFRIRQGVLPVDAAVETEWMILRRLWPQLALFIENERELRGGVPYKEHFEWFVRKAEEYSRQRYPNTECPVFAREFETGTLSTAAVDGPGNPR